MSARTDVNYSLCSPPFQINPMWFNLRTGGDRTKDLVLILTQDTRIAHIGLGRKSSRKDGAG
jgi:hypothetical protein